ncbi:MAG: DUF4251 domain-containing protein [Bacteroidales bacterium]|nr:DUF4251 domain-containing protein [Bacteroidales bacterium]
MKITRIFLGTLFALMVFVPQYSTAQESSSSKKEQRKLEKEKKKKEKQATELAERAMLANLLQNKQYVFMANTLSDDFGYSFNVTPKFNYLSVSGDTVVFQFAFDGIVGWNGIGGFTLVGQIVNYKFIPGKNASKPMRINARVKANTQWGNLYLTLTVYGEGFGTLTLSGHGGTLNMSGQIVSAQRSDVYMGNVSIYD